MGKILSIIYLVIILIALGVVVYFVGGVSRQISPIQSYEYQGSIDELVTDISNYTKLKSDGKYFITDTVGNIHEDYAIRVTIELKTDNNIIEYGLKIESQNKKSMPIRTNVYLTKAYNKTTISGGYQVESAGIKPLVDFFNSDLLSHLKKLHRVE